MYMCKPIIYTMGAILIAGCTSTPIVEESEPVAEAEWSNIYEKGFCVEWHISKKPERRCHVINEELVCRDEEDIVAKCVEW